MTFGGFLFFHPSVAPAAMLACLPPGEGPVLYVDAGLLRRTGLLDRIAGPAGTEDSDYRKLVETTGFDYRRDLDAVLVQFGAESTRMVVRGRFDMARLASYAAANGGQCAGQFCSMPASTPGKHISFTPLAGLGGGLFQPHSLAVEDGPHPMGATEIRANASIPSFDPPASPVWLNLPASTLHAGTGYPTAVNAFLEALPGAERAILSVEVTPSGAQVTLEAPCASPASAKEIEGRLVHATSELRELIARSGQAPDAASPALILSAGTFSTDQSMVRGRWPLTREFLDALGR
jgi:hypothetical protein